MPYYCTHCRINWASLETQDDEEEDESYDCCPKCKNDAHLIDSKEGDKFIYCQITGKIKNIKTGEVLQEKQKVNFVPEKVFDKQAWIEEEKEKSLREERALDAYHNIFESEGREAAEKAFFESLKKDL